MNMLVKWPTRQRPGEFLAALTQWRRLASRRNTIRYIISVDADDASMQGLVPRAGLAAMPDVRVFTGPAGRSKIQAGNADLPDGRTNDRPAGLDFAPDVLLLASDDMLPQHHDWDAIVAEEMARHFPALDGATHFNDGYHGQDKLITLSIMGWNLYRRFGYVYHPAYRSFYFDNEFTDVVRMIGKYHYDPRVIFRHQHVGRRPDALYRRNARYWSEDQAVYEKRRAAKFDQSPPVLSILIASLECRAAPLAELLAELHRQIFQHADPWAVEIHIARDAGAQNVGGKRDALLRRARGRYVCFIDDDDMIAPTYIHDILAAGQAEPNADCVVFAGRLEVDGRYVGPFDYSIAHRRYYQTANRYYRTPNHLCPVKRELALAVGFAPLNCGEDTDYARRLYPLLKTEASVRVRPDAPERKELYRYRFSPSLTATQKGR